MPSYDYVVSVLPWGQKLSRNVKGRVWVPAPDEGMARDKIYDDLFFIYNYSADLDRIVNLQLSLIEESELEEEVEFL